MREGIHSTAKAPRLHSLGQLDGSLQAIPQQGNDQRQQIADTAEAMAPDALRLADLLGAEDHLGYKRNGDRDDDAGLEQKGWGGLQELVVIDHGIERRKDNQDGKQRQAIDRSGDDRFQRDRPAHDRPARGQPEQDDLAGMHRQGVKGNGQGKEQNAQLDKACPTAPHGCGAPQGSVDDPGSPEYQDQVQWISQRKRGHCRSDQPHNPGRGVKHLNDLSSTTADQVRRSRTTAATSARPRTASPKGQ